MSCNILFLTLLAPKTQYISLLTVNYLVYSQINSFIVFSDKIDVQAAIAEKIIDESMKAVLPATELIDRSFLSKEAEEKYKNIVGDRHRRFNMK